MRRTNLQRLAIVLLCLALGSCAPRTMMPVTLDVAGVQPSTDYADLACVLDQAVTTQGRVKLPVLIQARPRLEAQLKLLAVTGPTVSPSLFADDQAILAYWYNARVAWSLELAVLAGTEKVDIDAMRRRSFPLDGRQYSLEQIDQWLLAAGREKNDFRIAACIPGVWINDAPLPRQPFSAAGFSRQLDATLGSLVLDERRFVIDVDTQTAYIPPMLWQGRDVLLKQYKASYGPGANLLTALRAYVPPTPRARLENAVGYRILPQPDRLQLGVQGRMIYFPGKVGRVELE